MKLMIIRLTSAFVLSILIPVGAKGLAQEFTLAVEHDHAIGSCKGNLIINADGVEYKTANKDHAREWAYVDIKMIKLVSPTRIGVLTYESSRKKLGADKSFEFKVLKDEVAKALSDFLLDRVTRPLATSFVRSDEKAQYEIPARHSHTFGGCQGTIKAYDDRLVYESSKPEDSRHWRWTDIQSISRGGPYRFTITTYEPKFGGPARSFNFDLKERMDDAVYDYVWAKINKTALPALLEVKK